MIDRLKDSASYGKAISCFLGKTPLILYVLVIYTSEGSWRIKIRVARTPPKFELGDDSDRES